jgi:SHS2 domain-containing protein
MERYELIDHTADVYVSLRGDSLCELFENAAYALADVQVDLTGVQAVEQRQVAVEAADIEQGLVRWLQKLLVMMEVEHLVPCRFEVSEVTDQDVKATVWGESLDETRHQLRGLVKAVTYHGLEIKEVAQGWEAKVLFDV